MVSFFDTSALVKMAVREPGWERIQGVFESADTIAISVLTRIEFRSALRRLVTEKGITAEERSELIDWLAALGEDVSVVPFDSSLESRAAQLLETHPLRTLDTIQLASAMLYQEELEAFVVCDHKLAKRAKECGLRVVNPVSEDAQ